MVSPHSVLALLASGLAGAVLAASPAIADERPAAVTQAATDVGPTGATLNGAVTPAGPETRYTFVYGTTRYNAHTPVAAAAGGPVSARIDGLQPQTTYHVRLVAF